MQRAAESATPTRSGLGETRKRSSRRPIPVPATELRALLEPVGGRRRRQRRARRLERAHGRRTVTVFARNSSDGLTWTGPIVRPAPAATGHQFFPDITTDGSTLSVILQDSRADPAYSPDRPMGNTAAGTTSGAIVDAYLARSANGLTWTPTLVSTARSNPNYENRGSARSPFFGDYNYVSATPDGSFFAVWTDTRDLVSATDPRDGNQDEGFDADTRTCNWVPDDIFAAAYSSPLVSDPCLSRGGLDQNIYGAGG
jgi:hypothetical protein